MTEIKYTSSNIILSANTYVNMQIITFVTLSLMLETETRCENECRK